MLGACCDTILKSSSKLNGRAREPAIEALILDIPILDDEVGIVHLVLPERWLTIAPQALFERSLIVEPRNAMIVSTSSSSKLKKLIGAVG